MPRSLLSSWITRPKRLICSALAVDHGVGRDQVLIKRGRVGDQLERRAGLVNVAHRAVTQQIRRGVAKLIGIERGPDGQRKNLAGMHILHHHRAIQRLCLLHRMVQRLLGQELNLGIDGQFQVAPGFRLSLVEPSTRLRASRRYTFCQLPVQLRFKLFLQAAEPLSSMPT